MLGLLTLSAVAYAAGTVVSLLLVVEPAEQQLLFGATVSDWFWVLSALLFATLAVVISLIIRAVLAADRGAGVAVSLLGLLGIGFALLSITHGYGWVVLAASLGLLAMNQTSAAQAWYRT